MPNRLALATSPYLLQHADNPVDWYEWGQEAWDKATQENKPVFLSIGYSSCHWCHVMAHESFEDQMIADILNRYFINIKLDREERPDIDDVYMTAVQLATGHGGWPMSVFLTPDKEPFFVGTYFPREPREGYPSFETLLINLSDAWQSQEAEIREKADEFSVGLTQVLERSIAPVTGQIDTALIDQAIQQLHSSFDYEDGGFGEQPKFPPHALLRFLIEYSHKRHHLPGDHQTVEALTEDAGHMAVLTLRRMAQGGIHDVVGGGFHRYATDSDWLLPHFEKMLYDNGQLLWLYSTAVELVDDQDMQIYFRSVCDQLVKWIDREMTSPSGHLYSGLDADSLNAESGHQEEGAYYIWPYKELVASVGHELAHVFNAHPNGNYSDESSGQLTGYSILHTHHPVVRPQIFDELLTIRQNRPKPGLDYKCLCSSNGLMIAGLVRAGALPQAENVAKAWMTFDPRELPHQVVNGSPYGSAFLDDYAFLTDGLIDLAIASQNQDYTQFAKKLAQAMIEQFAPNGQAGLNFTSQKHDQLFGQTRPAMDNATPSPNGVAIRALRKIGQTNDALFHLSAIYGWAQRLPQASATLLEECLFQLLAADQETILTNQGDSKKIEIHLAPEQPQIGKDGFAYAHLVLKIPQSLHINSHEPTADWLTPTTVVIEGVYGEASFPPSDSGELSGEVRIPLRFKPKEPDLLHLTVQVHYQLCSDTECFLPAFDSISTSLIQSG